MSGDTVINKLDELLRPHLKSGEKISSYKSEPLTAPGDNFGSTIISLDVTISNERTNQERTLHLVNKMIPQDPMIREMFNTKVTYIKEMQFYEQAVPAMLQLQQDCSVPQENWITNIVPKCYGARIGFGTEVDEDGAILLENLKYKGYELLDKRIGLDYNHARLALQKMAYIHALPIALKQKRPADYEARILPAAKYFVMNENNPDGGEMEEKFRETRKRILENLPLETALIEKVARTLSEMNYYFRNEVQEPFVSIMHDDLWMNNILFAPGPRSNDEPEEIAFVDFQLILLNTPICDVVFFIFSSVDTDVRRKHFDDFIDVYHESFVQCLQETGCDISQFTKSAMLQEMDRVAGSKLYTAFDRLRIMLADRAGMKDPEWYFRHDLGGDEYVRRICDVIVDFDRKGWLLS